MAEIEKFEGDIFWNAEDTENSVYDPDEELDNVGEGNIVEFEQAKRLPNFYGVLIDGKARFFDSMAETLQAIDTAEKQDSKAGLIG